MASVVCFQTHLRLHLVPDAGVEAGARQQGPVLALLQRQRLLRQHDAVFYLQTPALVSVYNETLRGLRVSNIAKNSTYKLIYIA